MPREPRLALPRGLRTHYTDEQIDIAFGVMSGRIDPLIDLRYFGDAKKLHPEIVSAMKGGDGNKSPHEHRRKAEEIVRWCIVNGRA